MRTTPTGVGTVVAVLAAWRDGVTTVLAQPLVLLAAVPTLVSWWSPTSRVPELLHFTTIQFATAAAICFVYGYRSVGTAPSLSTVGSIAARRLAVLVPFALIREGMTVTPVTMLIGTIGAGDVPGASVDPRPVLCFGMIGFYLLIRVLLFPQAVVAEGGFWRPLRRAWALSAGRFWLLAIAVWLPWFLIRNVAVRFAYGLHPGIEKIAGSAAGLCELAMLTVLYVRLAPTSPR